MQLPQPHDPHDPVARASPVVVRCARADVDTTARATHPARASSAEDLSYLDRLIVKPWGSEFRVYEDDAAEAWCLHIGAGHRTSLHCHPRKLTALLCLDGSGSLSTCTASHPLIPGAVLHIEAGAYHRSAADRGTRLTLLEVELPKDKFDLLRVDDDYRDPSEPYEDERHAPLALVHDARAQTPAALRPLVARRVAVRRVRLRPSCLRAGYRFGVMPGDQVRRLRDLLFAVALPRTSVAGDDLSVLGPSSLAQASSNNYYLTIRNPRDEAPCRAL